MQKTKPIVQSAARNGGLICVSTDGLPFTKMIMKSIRRMDYDEMLEFMNKNRLKEITHNDGIKISRNNQGGLDISVDDGEEMDLKFYISLFQGLAQS